MNLESLIFGILVFLCLGGVLTDKKWSLHVGVAALVAMVIEIIVIICLSPPSSQATTAELVLLLWFMILPAILVVTCYYYRKYRHNPRDIFVRQPYIILILAVVAAVSVWYGLFDNPF